MQIFFLFSHYTPRAHVVVVYLTHILELLEVCPLYSVTQYTFVNVSASTYFFVASCELCTFADRYRRHSISCTIKAV